MPEDNSAEIRDEDKLSSEEIQFLELEIPSYLRRKKARPEPTPVENRNTLTPQQAHEAELRDPYGARQDKSALREDLRDRLNKDQGGIASELDPINYNDVNKGEPTVPYVADPAKISNN